MFYAVFGRNGAGVYYNWDKVQASAAFISGMKAKKFKTLSEAMEYIEDGLVNVYGVMALSQLNTKLLQVRQNYFTRLPELML